MTPKLRKKRFLFLVLFFAMPFVIHGCNQSYSVGIPFSVAAGLTEQGMPTAHWKHSFFLFNLFKNGFISVSLYFLLGYWFQSEFYNKWKVVFKKCDFVYFIYSVLLFLCGWILIINVFTNIFPQSIKNFMEDVEVWALLPFFYLPAFILKPMNFLYESDAMNAKIAYISALLHFYALGFLVYYCRQLWKKLRHSAKE